MNRGPDFGLVPVRAPGAWVGIPPFDCLDDTCDDNAEKRKKNPNGQSKCYDGYLETFDRVETHSPPSKKIEATPIFFWSESWSFMICPTGSARMQMSITSSTTPMTSQKIL